MFNNRSRWSQAIHPTYVCDMSCIPFSLDFDLINHRLNAVMQHQLAITQRPPSLSCGWFLPLAAFCFPLNLWALGYNLLRMVFLYQLCVPFVFYSDLIFFRLSIWDLGFRPQPYIASESFVYRSSISDQFIKLVKDEAQTLACRCKSVTTEQRQRPMRLESWKHFLPSRQHFWLYHSRRPLSCVPFSATMAQAAALHSRLSRVWWIVEMSHTEQRKRQKVKKFHKLEK